ncbi:MAG: PEP-CTERM sorting domain-containing protein [Planctomycetota bacterium]|nr:MAG: PEP-CTERM sorting domain-containing protein [Planctomycetota bacterium]
MRLVRLGTLPGFEDSSFATGISASGAAVCGYSSNATANQAFRWTADGGMVGLGDLPGGDESSAANFISGDGTTVVGSGDQNFANNTLQAFRWTEATGMVGLGYTQGHHDWSEAWTASADGSVVSGISLKIGSDGEAFVWTQSTGIVGLGDLPGNDNYSVGLDMTPTGSVITGGCSPASGYEAFRWTQAGGMVPLGDLPGNDHYSSGYGITDDGNTIVGVADWDGGFGGAHAFIWDTTHGMRNLQTVLETEYGLDLTGWTLLYANDISGDGRYITGQGINPDGNSEAWLVDLGGCPGDFNEDGNVNTLDVLDFLNAWVAGC